MTEHPRRCKTCNDHTCRYAPVNGDYKTSSKRGAWKCTAEKGCASHSTPTEQRKPDLSHITPERKGCLTCLAPDCPIWQAADQNCWKLQPYTTTERDKVLEIQEGVLNLVWQQSITISSGATLWDVIEGIRKDLRTAPEKL